MQAAGVGFVTLGVFSWALLEPRPGEFDFGWLDEVVELLADGGIAIDMATATAAPPPWLTTAHPEILPVDHAGHTLWPGSRQSWCPSSPVFREHALALVEQMARRYGTPPGGAAVARVQRAGLPQRAVLVRRVGRGVPRAGSPTATATSRSSTTPGAPRSGASTTRRSTRCCRRGSRLRCPTRPSSWTSPASPPTRCWTTTAPSATCCAQHSTVPVTTNFMISAHQSEQDYFAWAPDVDVVSQDHYLDHRLPHPRAEQAFADDLTRGRRGRLVAAHGVGDVGGELAAGERREAARRAARRLAAPRRARRRRRRVLPVARVAGGRRRSSTPRSCRTPGRTRRGSARWSRSARR